MNNYDWLYKAIAIIWIAVSASLAVMFAVLPAIISLFIRGGDGYFASWFVWFECVLGY